MAHMVGKELRQTLSGPSLTCMHFPNIPFPTMTEEDFIADLRSLKGITLTVFGIEATSKCCLFVGFVHDRNFDLISLYLQYRIDKA